MPKCLSILMLLAFVVACAEPNLPPCKYDPGDRVRSVVSNQIGQVIKAYQYIYRSKNPEICYYTVRFAASQSQTNTSLLGSDGVVEVRPLATVSGLREFELEAANSPF